MDLVAAMAGLTEERLRRRRGYRWSEHPADVLPAFVADMDLPHAPAITEVLTAMVAAGDLGYTPRRYRTRLPELVSAWYAARGAAVDPQCVDLVPDVVVGSEIVLSQLCGPGDGVVISTPLYGPLRRMAEEDGRVAVDVPMLLDGDCYRPDLEGIGAALADGARVLLLCQPHNPTGTVHSAAEMARIVELVGQHDAWLVCDEIHAPLVLDGGAHHSALATGLPADRTVVVTSTSKGWNTAGLKCAVTVAGSPALAERLADAVVARRGGIGILGVAAMEAALEHGEEWRAAACQYLGARRDQLQARLAADIPGAVSLRPRRATSHGSICAHTVLSRTGARSRPTGCSSTRGWRCHRASSSVTGSSARTCASTTRRRPTSSTASSTGWPRPSRRARPELADPARSGRSGGAGLLEQAPGDDLEAQRLVGALEDRQHPASTK